MSRTKEIVDVEIRRRHFYLAAQIDELQDVLEHRIGEVDARVSRILKIIASFVLAFIPVAVSVWISRTG